MNYITEHPIISWVNHDGDTIKLGLFYGDDLVRLPLDYRIVGVDCPEYKGRTLAASKHVVDVLNVWLVRPAQLMQLQFDAMRDKYGRPMADIYHLDKPDELLSKYILDKKLGHPYAGGTKTVFTDEELASILQVQP